MAGQSFTAKTPEVVFDIDGEEFTARRMPGAMFVDFTRRSQNATEAEMADMLYDAFSATMPEAEFERFWKRCQTDVDIQTMMEVFRYLASSSANLRPTTPSSPSAAGRRRARAGAGSSAAGRDSKSSTSETSAT